MMMMSIRYSKRSYHNKFTTMYEIHKKPIKTPPQNHYPLTTNQISIPPPFITQ